MDKSDIRPYALQADEGKAYHYVGIDFTIKAGELGQGRQMAVFECITRHGEEPPVHSHETEDEIFYILKGEFTIRCGEETFELATGGFVFLPRGLPHGYTIRNEGEARLLVVTAPAREESTGGWGGFAANIENEGAMGHAAGQPG